MLKTISAFLMLLSNIIYNFAYVFFYFYCFIFYKQSQIFITKSNLNYIHIFKYFKINLLNVDALIKCLLIYLLIRTFTSKRSCSVIITQDTIHGIDYFQYVFDVKTRVV